MVKRPLCLRDYPTNVPGMKFCPAGRQRSNNGLTAGEGSIHMSARCFVLSEANDQLSLCTYGRPRELRVRQADH